MDVKINISARHVHLTEESVKALFPDGLHVRNMLNQKGQFAAEECVTIISEDGIFENVRVIGPERSYNQVEISKSDARVLKINPPVRKSGDLNGASFIKIKTDKGEISGNFVIIANRHVHFSLSDASNYGVVDEQVLKLTIKGEKPGVIDVFAKVSEDGFFEVHLDTDDANAFLINPGDIGELEK